MDERIDRWVNTASGPTIELDGPPPAEPLTTCQPCANQVHEQCDGTEPLRAPERPYTAKPVAQLACRCHRRGHEQEQAR